MSKAALKRVASIGLSQGLASAQNFIALSLVARAASADTFGRISLIVAVQVGALGIGQALFGQPYVMRHSIASADQRTAARTAMNAALLYSLVPSSVAALGAIALAGNWRLILLGFAVSYPAFQLYDTLRSVLYAQRATGRALAADSAWIGSWAAALVIVRPADPVALYFVWVVTALAGVVVGAVHLRMLFVPNPRDLRSWLRSTRSLRGPLLLEYASVNGCNQLCTLVVGAVIGLAPSGGLRAGQALIGPINTAFTALSVLALPEAVRAGGSRSAQGRRIGIGVSTVACVGALLLTPVVIEAGDRYGESLFGRSWLLAAPIVLLLLLQRVVMGLGMGSGVLILADQEPRLSATSRTVGAVVGLAATSIGAWSGGITGACYGLLVGSLATSVLLITANYGRRRSAGAHRAGRHSAATVGAVEREEIR